MELLSPKVDVVFKAIFGQDKNKDILKSFLESVLAREIEDLQIIDPVEKIESIDDKKPMLDIKVNTPDGDTIDIEIQVARQNEFSERSLYYWARMYGSQLVEGEIYTRLQKVITINILDFDHFGLRCENYHSQFKIRETVIGFELTDHFEMHFLELPKFPYDEFGDLEDNPLRQWMFFLKYGHKALPMEVLDEMLEPVQKAYKALNLLSASDTFKEKYEARQKAHRDLLQIVDDNRKAEAISMLEIILDAKGIQAEKYVSKLSSMPLEQIRAWYKEIVTVPTPQVVELLEKL